MPKQFWVIGAEYDDIDFSRPINGTTRVHGPFTDYREATREWHERATASRYEALTRYTIVTNFNQQAAATAG
jgi:hypothetical protein